MLRRIGRFSRCLVQLESYPLWQHGGKSNDKTAVATFPTFFSRKFVAGPLAAEGTTTHAANFSDTAAAVDSDMREYGIQLSDGAVKKLNELKASNPQDDIVLRVAVEGGGCSGFQYAFTLGTCALEGERYEKQPGHATNAFCTATMH
jgi:hypothetical protein